MAKKYNIDIKWIVILVVVAFLVIFEVIPLSYLLIRSLFPKGSFSLDSFKRVYTYDLNWTALINTVVISGLTTIFGVILAFPLAFLVGRTDMSVRSSSDTVLSQHIWYLHMLVRWHG